MIIEKIKNVADLSMDKVHCCYFDEGNLQVMDVKEHLNNTSIETDIYIYESRGKATCYTLKNIYIRKTVFLIINFPTGFFQAPVLISSK